MRVGNEGEREGEGEDVMGELEVQNWGFIIKINNWPREAENPDYKKKSYVGYYGQFIHFVRDLIKKRREKKRKKKKTFILNISHVSIPYYERSAN